MEKQESFDFPVGQRVGQPSRKVKIPRESTSLCAWCGQRMPSALLDHTPETSDLKAWVASAVYHADGCRWIETRGLRLNEGSHP